MSEIVFKLTDENRQTGHGWKVTTWRKGFRPPVLTGEGGLCSTAYYHGYDHPLLAILHNAAHANFHNPRMYRLEVDVVYRLDSQMKIGFTSGVVLDEIKCPEVSLNQRVRYALGIACLDYQDESFKAFADRWISSEDHTLTAAEAKAAWAAWAAVRAAEAAETNMPTPRRNRIDLIRIAEWAMTDEPLSVLLGEEQADD